MRELACDALVLSKLGPEEHPEYGNALLALMRSSFKTHRVPAAIGILEKTSSLERRIGMITHFPERVPRWSAVALSCFLLLGTLTLTDARSPQETGTVLEQWLPLWTLGVVDDYNGEFDTAPHDDAVTVNFTVGDAD